ncbi:Panacea domain-containing protein [Dehalococcoidales bacterium]|nr:Panacea domain-containing protein [Dehalococcoidales bacterium]
MERQNIKPQGVLQNIIVFLCFKSMPLSETKLTKLIYLVDVYHANMFGKRLTQVPFRHHYYGPWASDPSEELEKLCSIGIVKQEPIETRKGFVALVPKPAVKQTMVSLPDTAYEALKAVVADWGSASTDDVVSYSKSTLPFLGTPFGHLIDFERINFAAEYAAKHKITEAEAATEDILNDKELLNAVLGSEDELKQPRNAS